MKILHIGLASHYTENMLYQDNILTEMNAKAGHDVVYIGDAYCFKDGKLVKEEECDRILKNGIRLIKVKYDHIICDFITRKIQKVKKLVAYLNEIKPDAILYHGLCGYELIDVSEYAKNNDVLFYVDSHMNFTNTARTPIAKFAYKYVNGYFVKKALKVAKKVFYIGYAEKDYLREMYHIPEKDMEFFPLGGIIVSETKQKEYREELLKEMEFPKDVIICSHSGKMDRFKKTDEVVSAFSSVKNDRLRLLIYGDLMDDIRYKVCELIKNDDRVSFLGWKNAKEQEKILSATDLYIQPGSFSATAQVALCCGCALIVKDEYKRALKDSVFYGNNSVEVEAILRSIVDDEKVLIKMKEKGYKFAKEELDYELLANRYLK